MSSDQPTPRPVLTPEQREPMKQTILGFFELEAHLDDWAITDPTTRSQR
ncbi:hypothetical protein LG293_17615 (plasmid) [Citricoccus nitrophenolicus]